MVIRFDLTLPAFLGYHHTRDYSPVPSDFSRHCHDGYELIYIAEGEGTFIVEGSEYTITPGTVLFFRPREYHFVNIKAHIPYERHVFHFDKDTLTEGARRFLADLNRCPSGEGNCYPPEALPSGFVEMVKHFDDVQSLSEPMKEEFARIRLSDLIMMLTISEASSGCLVDDCIGGRVVRYLNEHIDTDETLEDLAERFNISKFYLCRAFKDHNGISIHGYLTRKRIMCAKAKMDAGLPAAAAAEEVGFRDYSAFFRAYRRIVGHSPRQMKK